MELDIVVLTDIDIIASRANRASEPGRTDENDKGGCRASELWDSSAAGRQAAGRSSRSVGANAARACPISAGASGDPDLVLQDVWARHT